MKINKAKTLQIRVTEGLMARMADAASKNDMAVSTLAREALSAVFHHAPGGLPKKGKKRGESREAE